MRCLALSLLVACAADRTLSEQPPVQCSRENEHTWSFGDDENYCLVPRPAFYSCELSVVHAYGSPTATEDFIPACDATEPSLPCWRADDAAPSCTGMLISIDYNAPPAVDDVLFGFCVTCD